MDQETEGTDLGDVVANGLSILSTIPIPAPIQKGFFKAVGRLTGAAIDIPAAKLESIAEGIRAETAARKAITIHAAKALTDEFQGNPELAARAQARATSKILREQVNVEDVLRSAAEELADAPIKEEPAKDPDDDWWNAFEDEAAKKSSEEMKKVFGRILAGELVRPGTFSIRSVRTVGEMDSATAANFARLCSLSISSMIEARVPTLGGNAGTNALQKYGLNFNTLQKLQQFGLIDPDFHNWRDYTQLASSPFPIEYAGRVHRLIVDGESPKQLKLDGVSLTTVGQELRRIVALSEVPEFTNALTAHLKEHGYALVPLKPS